MRIKKNHVYQGHVLDVMQNWPKESIDCVMTSPPYWGLRDYGKGTDAIWDGDPNCDHIFHEGFCLKCRAWKGQLGLEPTIQLYLHHLIQIFDEIRRILKITGTVWVNLGDTYGGSGNGKGHSPGTLNLNKPTGEYGATNGNQKYTKGCEKSLLGIPDRFKIMMIDSGWICRNEIIWYKRNCMPSSAKDRFTVDFEKIFFFTKNRKYWFEQQFETALESSINRTNYAFGATPGSAYPNEKRERPRPANWIPNHLGRNKRCVWEINPKGYPEAHFATYPEKLCETPIKSGCPEFICSKCGKPRKKIFEKTERKIHYGGTGSKTADHINASPTSALRTKTVQAKINAGYTDCGCGAEFIPGIVCDPFAGSGTTLATAFKLNRYYVGIEINHEYIELIKKRINEAEEEKKIKNIYPTDFDKFIRPKEEPQQISFFESIS